MTEDEWGPWIEHDGKGCPPCVIGQFIGVFSLSGSGAQTYSEGRVTQKVAMGIAWTGGGMEGCYFVKPVICYRVRKPRAMEQIRALLENLPERVDA